MKNITWLLVRNYLYFWEDFSSGFTYVYTALIKIKYNDEYMNSYYAKNRLFITVRSTNTSFYLTWHLTITNFFCSPLTVSVFYICTHISNLRLYTHKKTISNLIWKYYEECNISVTLSRSHSRSDYKYLIQKFTSNMILKKKQYTDRDNKYDYKTIHILFSYIWWKITKSPKKIKLIRFI